MYVLDEYDNDRPTMVVSLHNHAMKPSVKCSEIEISEWLMNNFGHSDFDGAWYSSELMYQITIFGEENINLFKLTWF